MSSYPRSNPLKSNRSVLNVTMADSEILNLHSKKTAFEQNSKLKILPVRCQTNTLLKSEGKREVDVLIIVALKRIS